MPNAIQYNTKIEQKGNCVFDLTCWLVEEQVTSFPTRIRSHVWHDNVNGVNGSS